MTFSPRIKKRIQQSLRLDRAIGLMWRSGPKWVVGAAVLQVLQGIMPLVGLYLLKLIVDAVTDGVSRGAGEADIQRVIWLVVAAGGAAIVQIFLQGVYAVVNEAQGARLKDYIQGIIQDKSISLDLAYFENPAYFDTLHRAQKQGGFRPIRIVSGLSNTIHQGVVLCAMVGLLLSFNLWMAAALFISVLPAVWVKVRYSERFYQWERRRTSLDRRAEFYHFMLTDAGFAKEIRIYLLGKLFGRRFKRLRKTIYKEQIRLSGKRTIGETFAQMSGVVTLFGALAYTAVAALNGRISLGDMVMIFTAFQRGLTHLKQLLTGLADLYEDNLFLVNFFEFLDQKSKITDIATAVSVPERICEGFRFEGVSYRYPGGANVLNELNLSLNAGEVTALVGENGSGKTTLARLLCRLDDPEAGRVRLDGIDLREIRQADLRKNIGIIFQDYVRFPMSARENIWYGDITKPTDDPAVKAAAATAGIDAVIRKLPKGYDTTLGRRFDQGEELSVGQWQRVALARTLMSEAPILILDEPGSAIDPLAEAAVFEQVLNNIDHRVVLLISHRFSTLRFAHRICVLKDGRIVETGTHEALLLRGGEYARMYRAQTKRLASSDAIVGSSRRTAENGQQAADRGQLSVTPMNKDTRW